MNDNSKSIIDWLQEAGLIPAKAQVTEVHISAGIGDVTRLTVTVDQYMHCDAIDKASPSVLQFDEIVFVGKDGERTYR